jgi:hypothetical protein
MKLNIKWATIDVESEEDALEIVEGIEKVLEGRYFRWEYDTESDEEDCFISGDDFRDAEEN